MRNVFAFIGALALSSQALASLELQSARCSSKDLTLNITLVSNDQVAETASPNAKGLLIFKAKSVKGSQILGKSKLSQKADLALEFRPQGMSLVSYAQGKIDLTPDSASALQASLQTLKPALYMAQGTNLEFLNAQVSFIKGQKITWDSCQIDSENALTLKKKSKLSEISDGELAESSDCPPSMSPQESELIMREAMATKKSGEITNLCLYKVARPMTPTGKDINQLSPSELGDLMMDLMSSVIKAEGNE